MKKINDDPFVPAEFISEQKKKQQTECKNLAKTVRINLKNNVTSCGTHKLSPNFQADMNVLLPRELITSS